MSKIKYSKDVDVLLIELSPEPIDHAEESGPVGVHFSAEGRPVLLEVFDAREFVLGSLSSVIRDTEVTVPRRSRGRPRGLRSHFYANPIPHTHPPTRSRPPVSVTLP